MLISDSFLPVMFALRMVGVVGVAMSTLCDEGGMFPPLPPAVGFPLRRRMGPSVTEDDSILSDEAERIGVPLDPYDDMGVPDAPGIGRGLVVSTRMGLAGSSSGMSFVYTQLYDGEYRDGRRQGEVLSRLTRSCCCCSRYEEGFGE